MELESARALKAELIERVLLPLAERANVRAAGGVVRDMAVRGSGMGAVVEDGIAMAARDTASIPDRQRFIALGVAPAAERNFRLAVRVQRRGLMDSPVVQHLVDHSRGEADVSYVGRIVKRAAAPVGPASGGSAGPWYRGPCRPLQIGASIGHYRVTAGTVGAFTLDGQGRRLILSNNHVLANENSCVPGDDIVQPGRYDGGSVPANRVGGLHAWVPLELGGPNLVDCAVATLDPGVECDPVSLRDVPAVAPTLRGVRPEDVPLADARVHKVGRTTGATSGRVTAFELDGVVVRYGVGNLAFDNQIEIEGLGHDAFSDGGDSGSLIVDDDGNAVGLLFAGSEVGGTNGMGLTYANAIDLVLKNLGVTLLYQ